MYDFDKIIREIRFFSQIRVLNLGPAPWPEFETRVQVLIFSVCLVIIFNRF
jgi:hypothetical protein